MLPGECLPECLDLTVRELRQLHHVAGPSTSRHQARAGSGLQTVITLSRWLTDYIFRSTVSGTCDVDNTHSDTARDKFHWFPPADYVWTDCVAVVLSAVSCQATLQLSVWQIQIAQCPDSGTSLTQQSLVPASTGQCCIDASIDIYVVSYHWRENWWMQNQSIPK